MGRILVLLTFAGLAAAFVIIYNASWDPVQSSAPGNSNAAAQGNTRGSKSSQADKKGRASSPRTASGRGSTKKGSNVTATPTSGTAEIAATAPKREPIDATSDSVKSDSTPVYSANTKRSKVLRSLRRGEKLPPDLEVIDSEGRWRLVRGSGKGKPGFIREEQIERPSENTTSRNKAVSEQPKQ